MTMERSDSLMYPAIDLNFSDEETDSSLSEDDDTEGMHESFRSIKQSEDGSQMPPITIKVIYRGSLTPVKRVVKRKQ